jgi:membrane-bound inhibitor of C-type lysozyme
MRANSSSPSLVVVVLTVACGCTPAEDQTVVIAPPAPVESPPAPPPVAPTVDDLLDRVQNVQSGPTHGVSNAAGPTQGVINGIADREASGVPENSSIAARTIDRLIYQCSDDITFAITVRGSRLQVFPPGYSNGFIVLEEVATDDGVRYSGYDADFRAEGDLATLSVRSARYVDCVSNPAAAVWQEPLRTR